MLYSGFDEVKKIFEDIQQDLERLKTRFPLGEKEFTSLLKQDKNQEKENANDKASLSLDGIWELIEKLKKNNIEWENKIENIDCSKKFYRVSIPGKKSREIIIFEKQRFLELKEIASRCNLIMKDVLSEKEWFFLSAYVEWNSMKGRIWDKLCQPNVAGIYLKNLKMKQEEAVGFYGDFVGNIIETYNLFKGDFENYFNNSWKWRKNDFYKEETDKLFREGKKEEGENGKFIQISMNTPIKGTEDDSTLEDCIRDNGLSVENRVILREALCQIIIELAGNMVRQKKDKTLYMPLFYTEYVVYFIKTNELGQAKMIHKKSIFEVMSQSFLDFFMKKICRTILEIERTNLKTYSDIGFKGMDFSNKEIGFPFRQKDANVYKKYIAYNEKFHVSDTSVDATLSKNYAQFEKILHGLLDSKYKEELLDVFSEQ